MALAQARDVLIRNIVALLRAHFRKDPQVGEIRAFLREELGYRDFEIDTWLRNSDGESIGNREVDNLDDVGLPHILAMMLAGMLESGTCSCVDRLYSGSRRDFVKTAQERCHRDHRLTDVDEFASRLQRDDDTARSFLRNAVIGTAHPYAPHLEKTQFNIGKTEFSKSMLFAILDTPSGGRLVWTSPKNDKGSSYRKIFESPPRHTTIGSLADIPAVSDRELPVLWCMSCNDAIRSANGCRDPRHTWKLKTVATNRVNPNPLEISLRKCPNGHVWSGSKLAPKICPVDDCAALSRPGQRRISVDAYIPLAGLSEADVFEAFANETIDD